MHKQLMAAILLLAGFAACTNNTTVQQHADSTVTIATADPTPQQSDMCFQRVTGNAHQDTATVHLIINGTTVSGAMVVKIAEKDTRAGILSGSIVNGIIKTSWLYTQEGMSDSILANFKLNKEELLQQRYSYNAQGREVIADTSAFAEVYLPVGCKLPLQ